MLKKLKNKFGTTLIETIVVVLVLAIIFVTASVVIVFFVQLFMYSPRQLDTQKIGQEIALIMIEGNQDRRGIRYAMAIIDASATQFSYTYGYPASADQLSVRFRWNAPDQHIYVSTSTNGGSSWSSETVIPYYISSATTVDGKDTSGVIFTYKKTIDDPWITGTDPVSAIRRVVIGINVKTSTGSFKNFQGSSSVTASAEIKGF